MTIVGKLTADQSADNDFPFSASGELEKSRDLIVDFLSISQAEAKTHLT